MNKATYDLLGVGIGPFNLSLAALLEPMKAMSIKFLDDKESFSWHPELMLDDAPMQTSYLKDLVTPVQPTNPYSYINYLVQKEQFYHFLNTKRDAITRYEFNDYLGWCSEKLGDVLEFNSRVSSVEFENDFFKITKKDKVYYSKNLCVASGPKPFVPSFAKKYLGENVFHAKSKELHGLNVEGKRILVVGGGQTGLEVFRNVLNERWGKSKNVTLITGRDNLQPLDEGSFTNEIFTPQFVSDFYKVNQTSKDKFTKNLVLSSDGNTPSYLTEFYNELYLDKFYKKRFSPYRISPMRWLEGIDPAGDSYKTNIYNKLNESSEVLLADIIIMATGFTTELPTYLEGLREQICLDDENRLKININYKLETKFKNNHIYMMNYSRHGHGVADPQTSLMSWRSAVIANDVLGEEVFQNINNKSSFIDYFSKDSL